MILLIIQADLNSAVVCMISTRIFINFSSPITNPLVIEYIIIYHYYCYYYFTLLRVIFTSVLGDCFPLEYEWQQISSSLEDSS